MPRAAICTHCEATLSVPEQADIDMWAQCPNCHAVFALASAAVHPLAELLIVDEPPAEALTSRAAAEPAGIAAETSEEQPDEPAAPSSDAVTLADLMPPAGLADDNTTASNELADAMPVVPPETGATVEFSPGALSTAVDTDFELDGLGLEPSTAQPVDRTLPGEFSLGVDPPDDDHDSTDVLPSAMPPRKRSWMRAVAGATVGGLAGLAIGYYLLLVIGGRDADALQLAQYLPETVLPDSFRAESVDAPTAPASSEYLPSATTDDSAEVPASFVMPIEQAAPPAGDERYADLPVSGAEPSGSNHDKPVAFAEPEAVRLTARQPRVINAPFYTADDLRAALTTAQQAQQGLIAGDLKDPAVRRTKGLSYARLCSLAEVLTYVDEQHPSGDDPSLQDEAQQLFRQTLADARTRDEVAQIVPIWISSPNREHGGVFLTGSVVQRSARGAVEECQLDIGQDSSIAILVPNGLASKIGWTGDTLGIVGAIVESPGKRVAGYTGTAPRAVWVRSVLPLE